MLWSWRCTGSMAKLNAVVAVSLSVHRKTANNAVLCCHTCPIVIGEVC